MVDQAAILLAQSRRASEAHFKVKIALRRMRDRSCEQRQHAEREHH